MISNAVVNQLVLFTRLQSFLGIHEQKSDYISYAVLLIMFLSIMFLSNIFLNFFTKLPTSKGNINPPSEEPSSWSRNNESELVGVV